MIISDIKELVGGLGDFREDDAVDVDVDGGEFGEGLGEFGEFEDVFVVDGAAEF